MTGTYEARCVVWVVRHVYLRYLFEAAPEPSSLQQRFGSCSESRAHRVAPPSSRAARLGQDNTATPGQVGSNHHAAVGRERKQPCLHPIRGAGERESFFCGSRAGRQTGGSERFNVQPLTGSARLGEEEAVVAAAPWRVTACVQAPAVPFCAPEHGSAPPQQTLFLFFF